MIEVQVGEDHIGDVAWRHALVLEAGQELAAFVLAGVNGARSGVDQDGPVARADQETAEGEFQSPLCVGPVLVTSPGVGFGWF